MILSALDGYYDRLAESGEPGIPLLGFGRQKIHFCLVINREGELVLAPQTLCRQEGKKRIPQELVVPEPVKRTCGVAANFLWDNTGYVLGNDPKGKPERSADTFSAFKKLQHLVGDGIDDIGMVAVLRFLDKWNPLDATSLRYWEELSGQNVVFRLLDDDTERYVHERPKVREAWLRYCHRKNDSPRGVCLVSGQDGPIATLHPAIKGVFGAQSSGAALVSFNLDAFKSYGKDQNHNAPIGEKAAFSYTTGLNWLLRNESRQKIRVGDCTMVFWAERKAEVEDIFSELIAPSSGDSALEPEDSSTDLYVRTILEAARTGRVQDAITAPDTPFYVLGLSPNASRLSVRFWLVSTVEEIVRHIYLHLSQIQIIQGFKDEPEFLHPPVWRLLRETAALNKSENISPLLAGAFIRAVLSGELYPPNLLSSLLVRIRADHNVNRLRAGLIKAVLVRNHGMEVAVSLDKNNTNIGYRLGRLFAVLELAQERANKGINSTIRDKYFGSASATPRSIFPALLSLSQKHLSKLRRDEETKGYYVYLDRNIEEIVTALDAKPIPAFLEPTDQGLFSIGYYHQRRDLFTKDSDRKQEE